MKHLLFTLTFLFSLTSFSQEPDNGMTLNRNANFYVSGTTINDIRSKYNVDFLIITFEYIALRDAFRLQIDWGQALPVDQKGKAYKPYVSNQLVPTKQTITEAKSIGAWFSYLASKGWVYYKPLNDNDTLYLSRYIFTYKE